MPRLLIGGDVVPAGRTLPAFTSGDAAALFGDLLPEFEASDLTAINLECPLIESESPIVKTGPVLGAPRQCVRGIEAAGVDVVGLANNHILDHGQPGLRSTLDACAAAGLNSVGAGENLREAERMRVCDAAGVRVGVVALAHREWSVATPDAGGAAPLDLAQFMRTVRRNQETYDVLIVLLHAGAEHYPYPSPGLRRTCRFLAEEGADAVLCQHSHRPGCLERYEGSVIVYGQGDLLFDSPSRKPPWRYEGFLVRLSVERGKAVSVETIPYVQGRERPGVRRMTGEEERAFRQELDRRSHAIEDDGFVEKEWRAFCREREANYLSVLHGHGKFLRGLHARFPWLRLVYGRRKRLFLHNRVRCESHREAIETICQHG